MPRRSRWPGAPACCELSSPPQPTFGSPARRKNTKAARRTIAESDAGRAEYLKRFYRIDRELPTHYDLVVNTDTLSPEQAASIIEQAARAI